MKFIAFKSGIPMQHSIHVSQIRCLWYASIPDPTSRSNWRYFCFSKNLLSSLSSIFIQLYTVTGFKVHLKSVLIMKSIICILGPYFKYRTYIDMIHQTSVDYVDIFTPLMSKLRKVPLYATLFLITSYVFTIEVSL